MRKESILKFRETIAGIPCKVKVIGDNAMNFYNGDSCYIVWDDLNEVLRSIRPTSFGDTNTQSPHSLEYFQLDYDQIQYLKVDLTPVNAKAFLTSLKNIGAINQDQYDKMITDKHLLTL